MSTKTTESKGLVPYEPCDGIKPRGINKATANKWKYTYGYHGGRKCHVANYIVDGEVVAQKIRYPNKDFTFIGDPKKAPLYGQWLWKAGGRKLVITEGEIDALSVSMVQDNKWPVVSVPNGAQGAVKSVQKALDWVESFESVVIMFDNDEPGQKAAKQVAELLTPGKAHIARLELKDPNEYLKAGRGHEIVQAMWNAPVYRPDGIVNGADLLDVLKKPIPKRDADYPWEFLNHPTRGLRAGELIVVGAGSGTGKSTFVDELTYSLITQGKTVGYVGLETSVHKAMLSICGLHLNKRIKIDGYDDQSALEDAWRATCGNGRVFFYDHFGSLESSNLIQRIRYMVKGCGCRWIIFDHVSIAVSGIADGDERRIIDNLMTSLRSLAEETNCGIVVVSHLRRPSQGTDWTAGRVPSESDFRGSGSIYQLSDMVIGLSRNSTHDDPAERNLVGIHLLKNRWVGAQGQVGSLVFNSETGRLVGASGDECPFEATGDVDDLY